MQTEGVRAARSGHGLSDGGLSHRTGAHRSPETQVSRSSFVADWSIVWTAWPSNGYRDQSRARSMRLTALARPHWCSRVVARGACECAVADGGASRRVRPCLDGHLVLLREVNQEGELCCQHGCGPVALNLDYVQVPVVDEKDVSHGDVAGEDSHGNSRAASETSAETAIERWRRQAALIGSPWTTNARLRPCVRCGLGRAYPARGRNRLALARAAPESPRCQPGTSRSRSSGRIVSCDTEIIAGSGRSIRKKASSQLPPNARTRASRSARDWPDDLISVTPMRGLTPPGVRDASPRWMSTLQALGQGVSRTAASSPSKSSEQGPHARRCAAMPG